MPKTAIAPAAIFAALATFMAFPAAAFAVALAAAFPPLVVNAPAALDARIDFIIAVLPIFACDVNTLPSRPDAFPRKPTLPVRPVSILPKPVPDIALRFRATVSDFMAMRSIPSIMTIWVNLFTTSKAFSSNIPIVPNIWINISPPIIIAMAVPPPPAMAPPSANLCLPTIPPFAYLLSLPSLPYPKASADFLFTTNSPGVNSAGTESVPLIGPPAALLDLPRRFFFPSPATLSSASIFANCLFNCWSYSPSFIPFLKTSDALCSSPLSLMSFRPCVPVNFAFINSLVALTSFLGISKALFFGSSSFRNLTMKSSNN